MKSLLSPARGIGGPDRVDLAVQRLEDEWRRHGAVDLNRLWMEQKRVQSVEVEDPVLLLSELIKTDLRCRYARGQSPSVSEYLETFSELRGANSQVLSLIYEQFCLGEERGDRIDVEAFCARYPQWADSLRSQLQYHRLISQAAGARPEPPSFPNPGDTFEEFQLLSLLGEGGTSRVFLARDLSLGGKQVVLKVSLDRGQEPKAQGALEHRHIVPVNSVVFGDRQLRGLSMPFRPGLPLDSVIKRVRPGDRPRSAMALWQTLVEGTEIPTHAAVREDSDAVCRDADVRAAGPQGDGWEGFPVRGSYPQGVAWIVMILARALDYAHRMRTFHRDVKPGNVLLTLDHGPQLLDFNLAESPHSAVQAEAAMHGGTLPYMAPEQIEAFLDPTLWGKVGAKADIYSLGLVFREMLTGQQPDLPAETISPQRAMLLLLDRRPRLDVAVSRFNTAIPHALEAILGKCLAFSPDNRYPDARALADDLDRFLNRKPLVHAVNPSRRERIVNWAVRNRRTLGEVAAVILIVFLLTTPIRFLLTTPIRRWFENHFVPIETSQALRSAVKVIDVEDPLKPEKPVVELIATFDELIKTYPDSWQPKVYLSSLLDVVEPQRAESLFRQALKVPNAHDRMLAWGKTHPTFANLLQRFARGRFDRSEFVIQSRPEAGKQEIRRIQRDHYSLAREALSIAVELRPDSSWSVGKLALCEQVMGDYKAAHDRMNRVIESINEEIDNNRKKPLKDDEKYLTQFDKETMLFEPTYIQCRIEIFWADDLRSRGSAAAKDALELLKAAETKSKFCMSYLLNYHMSADKAYPNCLENQALVTLSLGETEIDLGLLREADKSLGSVKRRWLPNYRAYLQAVDDKARLRELQFLEDRLKDAQDRLRQNQAIGARGVVSQTQDSEPPPNSAISQGVNAQTHPCECP
jgi:serine/threonine protein kinase/tetratricopeptide (TPR) repeat protein